MRHQKGFHIIVNSIEEAKNTNSTLQLKPTQLQLFSQSYSYSIIIVCLANVDPRFAPKKKLQKKHSSAHLEHAIGRLLQLSGTIQACCRRWRQCNAAPPPPAPRPLHPDRLLCSEIWLIFISLDFLQLTCNEDQSSPNNKRTYLLTEIVLQNRKDLFVSRCGDLDFSKLFFLIK